MPSRSRLCEIWCNARFPNTSSHSRVMRARRKGRERLLPKLPKQPCRQKGTLPRKADFDQCYAWAEDCLRPSNYRQRSVTDQLRTGYSRAIMFGSPIYEKLASAKSPAEVLASSFMRSERFAFVLHPRAVSLSLSCTSGAFFEH